MKKHSLTLSLVLTLPVVQIASGALFYGDLGTEETSPGSGVYQFINPESTGWSGNGTITGPTGLGTSTSAGSLTAVNDFTGSGILSMGAATGWGTTVIAGTSTEMCVSLIGTGSADISFNHGSAGPTVGHPLGMHLRDFRGDVTEMIVEFKFSQPVAPTATSALGNQPFLAGIDSNRGSGWNQYNFDAEYLGLMHTMDGVTMYSGMPSSYGSIDMNGNSTDWADDSASITEASITNGSWRGLNTFDIDDDGVSDTRVNGDGIIQDAENVYATGIRFTIRRNDGGSLSADGEDQARFLFSMNGTVHQDTVAIAEAGAVPIPEPTSIALLGLGTFALTLRRKRAN